MSRKTRSGFSRLISATADLPSPHSATTSRSGSSSSRLRRRSRAKASSSLSNTRMGIAGTDLLGMGTEGNVDLDDTTAAGNVLQDEAVSVAVELLQAGAGVAQSDAFGWNGAVVARQADAIVGDLQPQFVEHNAAGNADLAGSAARADAVADGVLH